MEILLPSSIITTFFLVLWIIKSPSFLAEGLLFQNNDGATGVAVSIALWVFLLMTISMIIYMIGA